MMDLQDILYKVREVALSVGRFQAEQRKTFSQDSVMAKHSHDYVSYVDKESEQMIVTALREILPEAGFLTEEKTTEEAAANAPYIWIVDPLDGTTNFIHNLGPWCVSIALKGRRSDGARETETREEEACETETREELLLGVVYEVTRQELFFASKGNGAWMQGADGAIRPIGVSKANDMDQALIAVGYPYNAEDFRDFCSAICHRLYGHCASLRSLGSAETELCYVAAGRLDVYLESFLQPWDVAAGAAIVQEAGGRVSDYSNANDLWLSGRQVLASNGLLHAALCAEIQAALREAGKC